VNFNVNINVPLSKYIVNLLVKIKTLISIHFCTHDDGSSDTKHVVCCR